MVTCSPVAVDYHFNRLVKIFFYERNCRLDVGDAFSVDGNQNVASLNVGLFGGRVLCNRVDLHRTANAAHLQTRSEKRIQQWP